MVQKSQPKRRGRPPAYDAEAALRRAMETFWDAGYSATSLDALSAATGMNRPSLYGAFGDKRALYLRTLERYRAGRQVRDVLAAPGPLREALRRAYDVAISLYLSGEKGARGCFLIGTAATEAVADPAVRAVFGTALNEIDDAFEARIRQARARGELPAAADPAMLGKMASAVLHTLALRARGGEKRAALEAIADAGVAMICGARPPVRGRPRTNPHRRA